MKEDGLKRNKFIAVIVTLLVHTALIAVLFFIFLPVIDTDDSGGILVNIGDTELASGMFTPYQLEPDYQTPTTPSQPEGSDEEPLLSQEDPESPSIQQQENEAKKREEEKKREQKRIQEELRQKELAEQRRREQIRQSVSGAFGNGENKEGSGNTAGATPGIEGSPDGNVPSGGVNAGVGGFGSFSLKGRRVIGSGLQRPSYDAQVEGTIVIEIIVSPAGNVIKAHPTSGTNIDNYQMRQSAVQAAMKTKFNPIDGPNNQIGTITYRYRLN